MTYVDSLIVKGREREREPFESIGGIFKATLERLKYPSEQVLVESFCPQHFPLYHI